MRGALFFIFILNNSNQLDEKFIFILKKKYGEIRTETTIIDTI
jgi:hypothetical protein